MPSTDKLVRIILKLEDQTSKQLNTIGSQLDRVGDKMTSIGKKMSVAVTAPLVAAGAAGVKMAMDLDEAMRNIQSVGGQTEAELEALSDTFVDMSTDLSKTTDSAQNLAEAFYDIQGSGFEGADAMKVLEAATMAASAGLTETSVAAEGITAVINSYGLAAEDAAYISDLMFSTVDRGVGSFEELTSSMSNVVGSASTIGVGFDEVSAAIATMSKQGMSFSEASISLNQALISFISPSEAMSKAIHDLGYESGQAMIDALGFAGSMQALEEYTGGSASEMSELFGNVRGLRGALALTGSGAQMFTEDLEAMGNVTGRTAEAFAVQTEAFAAQWKNFQNTLNALLIEVGQIIIPVLNDLLQNVVIPLIQAFRNLPEGVQRGIVTFLALVAAIGPVLVILGSIISAIGAIGSAITTLAPVFAALGAGLAALSAPVLIIIGIIAALTAAIIALWMNREKVGEWAQSVQQGMSKATNSVQEGGKAWQGVFAMFPEVLRIATTKTVGLFSGLTQKIVQAMQNLIPALQSVGTKIITGLIKGIQSKVKEFIDMIVDMARQAVNAVNNALQIRSPSKVFKSIGANVVHGFNEGIKKTAIDVNKFVNILKDNPNINLQERIASELFGAGEFRYQTLSDAQKQLVNQLTQQTQSLAGGMTLSPTMAPASSGSSGGGGGGGVHIGQLVVPPGTTEQQIDYIMKEVAKRVKRKGGKGF